MVKSVERETHRFFNRKVTKEKLEIETIKANSNLYEIFIKFQRQPPCELPDLTVLHYETGYVNTDYRIKLEVGNIGQAKSGQCLVYCNAISHIPHPGVNEIRLQGVFHLGEIDPGSSDTCGFSFDTGDMWAKEVDTIMILVDSKDFVLESDESNNTEVWNWPT